MMGIQEAVTYVVYAPFVLLFLWPSALSLVLLARKKAKGLVLNHDAYLLSISLHVVASLLSPGLLILYLIDVSRTCHGGGCGSGVWMIFVLPVAWFLWFLGHRAGAAATQVSSGAQRKA